MALLTGDAYQAALAFEPQFARLAELQRNRLLPAPEVSYSFGQQLGAAFRQENLFVNHVAPLFGAAPVYAEDPDYDPEADLGSYAQYTKQFPELKNARSAGHMAALKNRIDGELRDRRMLEGMGFGRSLAVFLPAGLLSPENFIPLGSAARAMGVAGKTIGKTALRVGAEGAITAALAEMALADKKRFRTTDEAVANIVGGGLFGSLFGAAGAALPKGTRELTKKVLGAETITDAVQAGNKAIADALADPTSELGLMLDAVIAKGEAGKPLGGAVGATDLSPTWARVDDFIGETLASDTDDPLRGAMLKVLKEHNPNLAKLVGADSRLGRIMMKGMFLNPSQRAARSPNPITKWMAQTLDRQFIVVDGPEGASVQQMAELHRNAVIRKLALAERIFLDNEKLLKAAEISEDEFYELAGNARVLGDQIGPGPEFDKVRGKPELEALVVERAKAHAELNEIYKRTAGDVGAMSLSEVETGVGNIVSVLDPEYMHRAIHQDVVRTMLPEFRDSIVEGLIDRKGVILPDLLDMKAAIEKQIELSDNKEFADFLREQVGEVDEWIAKVDNDDFTNIAQSIVDNYTAKSQNRVGSRPFQSQLLERVMRIDDRFLKDFMVRNVADLEARALRSLLPDLVMADHFEMKVGQPVLSRSLHKRLEQLTNAVNKAGEDGLEPELAHKLVTDMQDMSDDAQALVLGDALRFLKDFDAVGIKDIDEGRELIAEALPLRKETREEMVRLDREIEKTQAKIRGHRKALEAKGLLDAELEARTEPGAKVPGDEAAGRPTSERKSEKKKSAKANAREERLRKAAKGLLSEEGLKKEKALLENLKLDRQAAREFFDGVTEPVNTLARKVGEQLGDNVTTPIVPQTKDLLFKDNMVKLPKANNSAEATAMLRGMARVTHARVTAARRFAYQTNVGFGHIEQAVRREAAKGLPNADKPGMRIQHAKQVERDIKNLSVMHDRIRNRHGVGATNDAFALTTKRIRDFNFMTKMGSVLFSSFPDVAMAVSTAGFTNYARAIGKFVSTELFGDENAKRTYGQELHRAAERFGIFKRHELVYGLDDNFRGAVGNRVGRSFDGLTDRFAALTLMDRWNSANKMIAAQAIESRVAKTILAKNPSKRDLMLLQWAGISEGQAARFRKELETHSFDDGGLRLAGTETWGNRNLRIQWEAQLMGLVQATIITPTSGDLPAFVTAHPLGRMLMQFRTFSFASTNKFIIPGLQRTLAAGDPGPALAFTFVSTIGLLVHSMNEVLKGRDPREQDIQNLVYNGIDRGGGLGILTEAGSTVLSTLNGLGIEGLGARPSRFSSRNLSDTLAGPSAGLVNDLGLIAAMPFQESFTPGDASRIRRMIPFQNLWLTRLLLDGGLNAPGLGTQSYFDDHLKFEHRVFGFDASEVP